jgi:uncharacterized protein YggE
LSAEANETIYSKGVKKMAESIRNSSPHNQTMTLTGGARVTLIPDIAVIHLGVQNNGTDLQEMQVQNAQTAQTIVDALHQLGVRDIKTFQYTIDKLYGEENGTPVDSGYTVRNILEIKTDDLAGVGGIIDVAVDSGANVVDLIAFEVTQPELYYQQALNLSIMNAIEKARSIARNLGISINSVPVSIVENSMQPALFQSFQRDSASTPVIPGNITVDAMVTTEFVY